MYSRAAAGSSQSPEGGGRAPHPDLSVQCQSGQKENPHSQDQAGLGGRSGDGQQGAVRW